MKFIFTTAFIISIVLIFVAGDDHGKGFNVTSASKSQVVSGLTTLAPPVNESALPCDVKLLMSANHITELLKQLGKYKSQRNAMKVIMKQVLNLIIANIYDDEDEEAEQEEAKSKDVDARLQNFDIERKKRKTPEIFDEK